MNGVPSLTLAAVRKLDPCKESYNRVAAILPKRGKITAAQAVKAGCTLDDLVWVAGAISRKNKAVEHLLRHWMADCASRVLHIYERDYPNDLRVREAITVAHQYADGKIETAAALAARDAARAARDAAWAAGDAAWAAGDAAWAAAWAARDAARAAAWGAGAAAWAARDAARAAGDAAWAAEEKWQLDRLVYWLSEESPLPLPLDTERAA